MHVKKSTCSLVSVLWVRGFELSGFTEAWQLGFYIGNDSTQVDIQRVQTKNEKSSRICLIKCISYHTGFASLLQFLNFILSHIITEMSDFTNSDWLDNFAHLVSFSTHCKWLTTNTTPTDFSIFNQEISGLRQPQSLLSLSCDHANFTVASKTLHGRLFQTSS